VGLYSTSTYLVLKVTLLMKEAEGSSVCSLCMQNQEGTNNIVKEDIVMDGMVRETHNQRARHLDDRDGHEGGLAAAATSATAIAAVVAEEAAAAAAGGALGPRPGEV